MKNSLTLFSNNTDLASQKKASLWSSKLWAFQSQKTKLTDMIDNRVNYAAILDMTESTSALIDKFRNTIGNTLSDLRSMYDTLFQPIRFDGEGVHRWEIDTISILNQPNIGWSWQVSQSISAVRHSDAFSRVAEANIVTLITDLGLTEESLLVKSSRHDAEYISNKEALLLVVIDSPCWELKAKWYRETYSEVLWDNLFIIWGCNDACQIVKTFTAERIAASVGKRAVNSQNILKSLWNMSSLRITQWWSSEQLRLT